MLAHGPIRALQFGGAPALHGSSTGGQILAAMIGPTMAAGRKRVGGLTAC